MFIIVILLAVCYFVTSIGINYVASNKNKSNKKEIIIKLLEQKGLKIMNLLNDNVPTVIAREAVGTIKIYFTLLKIMQWVLC